MYFIGKKMILTGMVVLVLAVGFVAGSLLYFSSIGVASKTLEAVYQGNSGKKAVAITVNVDWGEEFIAPMLEAFKNSGGKATFFVTGTWAEKNQELLKEMAEQGHSIQNHGYKHLHFNNLSSEQAAEQIKLAEDIIKDAVGQKSCYFAPPYGEQNRQLVQTSADLGYKLIMWSIDTIDWQRPDPATIVKRVTNKLHNDAIILMHPTDPTVKALPELLAYLEEQGYEVVTLDQILLEKTTAPDRVDYDEEGKDSAKPE